jgi:ATP-dependent exoDNAse (exonuclease V) alpha subunit
MNIDNKENTINLKLENNKTITLPQTELKHFDYAYASTAYSAQGKTANNVIAVLESYRKNLTNQQTFYVEISRAKNQAFLITDNKEKLQQTLEKQTGEKISVLTDKEISKSLSTQDQNKSLEKGNKTVDDRTIKTKDFDLER